MLGVWVVHYWYVWSPLVQRRVVVRHKELSSRYVNAVLATLPYYHSLEGLIESLRYPVRKL